MRFEHPAALALIPLILLLFFSRRRLSRVRLPVATLHLWAAASPTDVTALARRLRRHWLLILQAAFLAAAALALAGPMVAASGRSVAVLFDTSISMGARQEGGTTRLAIARARAKSLVEGLPGRTRVHIMTADSTPRSIATLAASDPAVTSVIESIQPSDAPADLASAIQYARAEDAAPQRIYVFSDADWSRIDGSAAADVEWSAVGAAADNVAITGLSARRVPQATEALHVLVSLSNHGVTPANGTLTLDRDGAGVTRLPVILAARSEAAHTFTISSADGVLTARLDLDRDDALSADNVRRLVVPAPSPIRVLLVAPQAFFLEKALTAHPGIVVTQSPTADHDVVVCESCPALPGGNAGVLFIPPASQTPRDPVALVKVSEHPVSEGLEIDAASAILLANDGLPEGSTVIARGGGEPALVAYETAGRRVLEVRIDLENGPFPLSTAFPVLMANALDWLANRAGNATALSAGDPLEWRLPAEPQPPEVIGPNGRAVHSTFRGGILSLADTRAAGVYQVRLDSGDLRVAVNPAILGEADLTVIDAPARAPAAGADAARSADRDLTAPVALIALLLLTLEWRYRLTGRLT